MNALENARMDVASATAWRPLPPLLRRVALSVVLLLIGPAAGCSVLWLVYRIIG